MAEVHLPPVLLPLFQGLPRELPVEAGTVLEAIERLDERWPGFRDRLVDAGPALRPHINVYVDRERGGLETVLEPASRVDVIAAISGGYSMRFLLTSAGVKNASIRDALVDLLGKPIAESSALCIPTAAYGHPMVGPGAGPWQFISGRSADRCASWVGSPWACWS